MKFHISVKSSNVLILIVADDSTDSDQKDGATLLAKVKEAKGKNSYTGLTLH